jgi:hypothetical protein
MSCSRNQAGAGARYPPRFPTAVVWVAALRIPKNDGTLARL